MPNVMVCPRCEQGLIDLVRFGRAGLEAQKCQRCDAAWPPERTPALDGYVPWQDLLAELGETPDTAWEVLRANLPRPSEPGPLRRR